MTLGKYMQDAMNGLITGSTAEVYAAMGEACSIYNDEGDISIDIIKNGVCVAVAQWPKDQWITIGYVDYIEIGEDNTVSSEVYHENYSSAQLEAMEDLVAMSIDDDICNMPEQKTRKINKLLHRA